MSDQSSQLQDQILRLHAENKSLKEELEKLQKSAAGKVCATKLNAMEAEMEMIVDYLPAMIFYKDTENRFLRVNKSLSEGLKIPKEKMEGTSCFDLFPKDKAQAYLDEDLKVLAGKKVVKNIVEPWDLPDGRRWISTTKIPCYDENDKAVGIIGISRDITEQKQTSEALAQSEELYRTIAEHSDSVIWKIDLKTGQFTYCSPSIKKLTGFEPEEIKVELFEDLCGGDKHYRDVAQKIEQQIREFAAGDANAETRRYDHCIPSKSGAFVWTEVEINLIADKNNQPIEMLGISRDIRERKKTEEIIQSKNRELEMINSDKDRFISILGHDLRSPFNGMLGFLNLLVEKHESYSNEEMARYLDIANRSANNAFRLLNDLLLWVKADSGKIEFRPKIFKLSECCREMLEQFQLLVDKKEIVLEIDVAEDMEVYTDKNLLMTIARNLVSNAIKYTLRGGTVKISAVKDDQKLTVSVQDNGVGMSDETVEKILDRSQLYTTLGTANEKGTGLGLLICKEFASKMGAEIHIETQLGLGSTFFVHIPLQTN